MSARKRGQRPLPHALGLRDIEPLPAAGGAGKLAAFAVYRPGSLAPWWLHQGVCAAWGLDVFRTELRLVTVSDIPGFAQLGGMIELPLEGERVGIVINRSSARKSGFEFNAQLLRLARVIDR